MGHNIPRGTRFSSGQRSPNVGVMLYSLEQSKVCTKSWGTKMLFERVKELTEATPTEALCEAWGAVPDYVSLSRLRVQGLTVEEAGDLAALHGLTLPDILAV